MLVQAQVVPWWGTGRPAEFSLSGCHPVTGIAHRQEDSGVRLQNGGDSVTASITHAFAKLEIRIFWCPLPWGSECSGNYQPRGNGKTARESARQIPACSSLPGTESLLEMWLGRSNRSRADLAVPGLREFRLAESEQILPSAGNRKPASDRAHWIQPVPCSSRRGSCPGRERGDRQSSVPADPTPSRAQPTGRRIAGYDYKTESFQRPRAEQHTHFREIRKFEFFWCPLPWGSECSGNYQPRGNGKTARGIDSPDPRGSACPGNRKPAGDLARQIEPLPSRSRRHLDYESSGSPRPSRSYR